jgi:hypothetical protein
MPLRATYHPLGFSLEISTNSPDVLTAAQESWGYFQKAFLQPQLRICIGVLDDGSAICDRSPVVRARGSMMVRVADADNYSVSNIESGFAFAWLTRATVTNKAYLRWHFIEGMTWDLLEPYLTPVHAACVRKEDCGILLCGDSGAGKSSLSYACALRGWKYLADDSCCLVRGGEDRTVIGNPYQIRFRESAVDLFPQLKEERAKPRLNGEKVGEMALELLTARVPEISTITNSFIDYIIFLNRNHGGPVRLVRYPKVTALHWFDQVICCGEKKYVNAHRTALRKLAAAQIFELRYTDLDSAIGQLETLAIDDHLSTSTARSSEEDVGNV